MNKNILKIILLINILKFCYNDSECLKWNNSTDRSSISLSTCTQYNDDNNESFSIYNLSCCLLTMTYKNNSDDKYCLTANKTNKDSIEERIELFKLYDLNISRITIDCSSKHLNIALLFIILLII